MTEPRQGLEPSQQESAMEMQESCSKHTQACVAFVSLQEEDTRKGLQTQSHSAAAYGSGSRLQPGWRSSTVECKPAHASQAKDNDNLTECYRESEHPSLMGHQQVARRTHKQQSVTAGRFNFQTSSAVGTVCDSACAVQTRQLVLVKRQAIVVLASAMGYNMDSLQDQHLGPWPMLRDR